MKICFKNILLYMMACIVTSTASAQFAPAVGYPGSTAISKDSSAFVAWANACEIQRGYKDIAIPDSGYASVGDVNSAIGMAGLNGVVSIGDGGTATLTFPNPIYNGPGFDFAVFENGFYNGPPLAFLEFAFVEVSSDGNNFFRFPATSNIQDTTQVPITGVDCSLVNNLAGKYIFGYGTPFDLEELKSEIGLDVNHITHIRLIDVVGSVNNQYATYDQFNHKINDPYPTLFISSGFDLDAVGVINQVNATSMEEPEVYNLEFSVYPNPNAVGNIRIASSNELIGKRLKVQDSSGRTMDEFYISLTNTQFSTANYPKGLYFLSVGTQTTKLIIE